MAPRTSNYGSIEKADEERPFLIESKSGSSGDEKGARVTRKVIVSILALLVVAMSTVVFGKYFSKDQSNGLSLGVLLASPERDLGIQGVNRAPGASPNARIWGSKTSGPLPTNSWYLNLVSHRANVPDDSTRVYTIPYIIDTAASKPLTTGIRVHWPIIQTHPTNIQMVNDFHNALCLGTIDKDMSSNYTVDEEKDLSLLGVSLEWRDASDKPSRSMKSSLVRGMPYASMKYSGDLLPSIFSYNGPASNPVVDDATELQCGSLKDGVLGEPTHFPVTVKKDVTLHFINSDFTWMVFFSQPVKVICGVESGDSNLAQFLLNVVSVESEAPLIVRVALLDECTTGQADIKAHCDPRIRPDTEEYKKLLRQSSNFVPGNPTVDIDFGGESSSTTSMLFDFGQEAQATGSKTSDDDATLIMFALPHHQDEMGKNVEKTDLCFQTFHGRTCLVKGTRWVFEKEIDFVESFTASRPPKAEHIPLIADALLRDIQYSLSNNTLRGAADTYFSGKLLARVARVIVIANELKELAKGDLSVLTELYRDFDPIQLRDAIKAAAGSSLPPDSAVAEAVDQLKRGVEIWLTKAEAQYLYDRSWGGLVNCGCTYQGKGDRGICNNTFPNCPALEDVNIDFGNGYYNDHHCKFQHSRVLISSASMSSAVIADILSPHSFRALDHYGYHVYAAATVARNDPAWARDFFPKVLLYIRDYANPFADDDFFTAWRHKDWFLGSSWASGIVSAENSPHGRNEESSSEAIAAYESMALFGKAMVDVMKASGDKKGLELARRVQEAGRLLAATEIEATNRYWHVWSSANHKNSYPEEYSEPVVGMLYDTMASFQTWFAPSAETSPLVSYGIQLMPFTPVSESRDDPEWAKILYPKYKESCEAVPKFCEENGWSILQACLYAETGNVDEALQQLKSIPDHVFDSQGGIGNSITNTIWFISTRSEHER